MVIIADADFNQTFNMFIMKTELLLSLLCVTLSVSTAAVVPVENVPEERADVSVPVVPVEDVVPEERADVSDPVVAVADVEEEEAELVASEEDDVQEETAELSDPDVALEDILRDIAPQRSASYCPRGWHPYEDNCYLLVNLTYSWINAEFLCESLGSSLASAHSLLEYNFLKQLTWRAGFLTSWIGGYRFQGYWRWNDGTPFDYNNWYSHSSSSSYDCLYLNSQDSRGWTSERCHFGHPFICSFKLNYC